MALSQSLMDIMNKADTSKVAAVAAGTVHDKTVTDEAAAKDALAAATKAALDDANAVLAAVKAEFGVN